MRIASNIRRAAVVGLSLCGVHPYRRQLRTRCHAQRCNVVEHCAPACSDGEDDRDLGTRRYRGRSIEALYFENDRLIGGERVAGERYSGERNYKYSGQRRLHSPPRKGGLLHSYSG